MPSSLEQFTMPDTDEFQQQIVVRIRERMSLVGLTQEELSLRVGRSRSAAAGWFHRGAVPLALLREIATALETSPHWLLWGEEERGLTEQVERLADRQEQLAARLERTASAQERLSRSFARVADGLEKLLRELGPPRFG